jgi:fumarate hydratase subunit beta
MDPFTPALLAQGIKGLIGKGYRSPEVKKALVAHRAVYFATVGGAAALLARHIISSRIAAYPELGPEAIFEFTFEDFPAFVINDIYGEDAYQLGRSSFIEMRQREKDAK